MSILTFFSGQEEERPKALSLAIMIAKESSTQVEILGQNPAKNIERYVPSIEKAKHLGLRVYTPLEQAIELTLEGFKNSFL